MYWDDFRKFLHENRAYDSVLKYWYKPEVDPHRISVMDRNLPRRKGVEGEVIGGWSEQDHWLNSHVGDAAFFNGEIPYDNPQWMYDEERNKFVEVNHRGAKALVELLIREGCVRRTPDVERFLKPPTGCPLPRLAAD